MNRSAYLTTGLAIKTISRLSKADIALHGKENIPDGPVIFVINHFTRVETFLLPSCIFTLTNRPVWSLADSMLFKGGFGRFLELVGAVSTKDPQRDDVIVRTLLTGEAHWVIFPEGSMVKTKQIMKGGRFMITDPRGMREPHTGAAVFALRAEMYRRYLLGAKGVQHVDEVLSALGITSLEEVTDKRVSIVPVNLTYYPIRARDNIASIIAAKMVKDIPERMMEEIMTEGTMLLSGVDMDIRFGKPIYFDTYLNVPLVEKELQRQQRSEFSLTPSLISFIQDTAQDVMQRYMGDIYAMTTVNHDHLFASFLRMYPYNKIKIEDLKRRVFYAATLIRELEREGFHLHKSLCEDQTHLVTDDRYHKFDHFLQLALDKGVLTREGEILIRGKEKLSTPVSFHRGRIDNPIEIIANEVEPLTRLKKLMYSLAWQPDFLLKMTLAYHLIHHEKSKFSRDLTKFGPESVTERMNTGKPFLLPGISRRLGVVLVHSYLATPAEVRRLAVYLNKRGLWVYAPRLAGHGTSSADLAGRSYKEWYCSVENGYAIMRNICDRVILGGVSVGASLVFNLAGSIDEIAGIFAVCPPLRLNDFSSQFMPAPDVWNRMLSKMKGERLQEQFLDFSSDNSHINYCRNPLSGIREVGKLLGEVQGKFKDIVQPTLIIQTDKDPVVDYKGAESIYHKISSQSKEFCLVSSRKHVPVNGEGAKQVHLKIGNFVKECMLG